MLFVYNINRSDVVKLNSTFNLTRNAKLNNGFKRVFIIGIKHGFPCINVFQVPREMLKTEAEGRGFQQFPRDLANVNAVENNVWSLLLHKFNHNAEKITKMAGLYFRPHHNYLADSYTHYPFL